MQRNRTIRRNAGPVASRGSVSATQHEYGRYGFLVDHRSASSGRAGSRVPIMESADNRFTITVTFERVLAGVKVVNEFGGGQGIPPSLTNALSFEIQGVAMAA